jgi:cytochrome P450
MGDALSAGCSSRIPEIDMTRFEFWQDPHAVLGPAREQHPLALSRPLPVVNTAPWIVLRYSDVESMLADRRLLSCYGALTEGMLGRLARSILTSQEGEKHTRLRALVSRAFTPRRIEAARPVIRATAQALLRALEAGSVVDFQQAVANQLTMQSICRLLGVPQEDVEKFGAWTGALFPGANPGENHISAGQAVEHLYTYVGELAARRRRDPRDDLIDALIAAEEAGDRLSSGELEDMVLSLLIGGHDTVRSFLGILCALLLRHPDALAEVTASPARIANAVEEALRFESPLMFAPRTAGEAVLVGDTEIAEGSLLLLNINSANRDPRRFRDPDRFDIGRGERADLAFGYGRHYCVGAALARAEACELLSVWTGEGPALELAEQPQWVPFAISRRFQSIRVRVGERR